jgi:hypothetical protein
MTRPEPVVIRARGHERITATHGKTFELSTDADIGPRATCVIGVAAVVDGDLSTLCGPVAIELRTGELAVTVAAEASPFVRPTDGLVVRKSDFRGADTLAINADAGAADLDRWFVRALAQADAELVVTVRPVGERRPLAVFTDEGGGLPDDDAEVVAAGALAQMRACAAVAVGNPDCDALVVTRLPRGATARRAHVAAAVTGAPVVVWRGRGSPPDELVARASAFAVDRGEVVTRVTAVPPQRFPDDAITTLAIPGTPPEDQGDISLLLQALLSEGISPKTLRQALRRLPHLEGRWDYDALRSLQRP